MVLTLLEYGHGIPVVVHGKEKERSRRGKADASKGNQQKREKENNEWGKREKDQNEGRERKEG